CVPRSLAADQQQVGGNWQVLARYGTARHLRLGGAGGVKKVRGQWPQHELRVDADGCLNLIVAMFTLRCTKQLLDRMGHPAGTPEPASTGLGDGYATALFWKPQMALLVNERKLLPVVLPLAPSARLAQPFPGVLKEILQTL